MTTRPNPQPQAQPVYRPPSISEQNSLTNNQWYVTAPSPASSVSVGAGSGAPGIMLATAQNVFVYSAQHFAVQSDSDATIDTPKTLTMRAQQATTVSCLADITAKTPAMVKLIARSAVGPTIASVNPGGQGGSVGGSTPGQTMNGQIGGPPVAAPPPTPEGTAGAAGAGAGGGHGAHEWETTPEKEGGALGTAFGFATGPGKDAAGAAGAVTGVAKDAAAEARLVKSLDALNQLSSTDLARGTAGALMQAGALTKLFDGATAAAGAGADIYGMVLESRAGKAAAAVAAANAAGGPIIDMDAAANIRGHADVGILWDAGTGIESKAGTYIKSQAGTLIEEKAMLISNKATLTLETKALFNKHTGHINAAMSSKVLAEVKSLVKCEVKGLVITNVGGMGPTTVESKAQVKIECGGSEMKFQPAAIHLETPVFKVKTANQKIECEKLVTKATTQKVQGTGIKRVFSYCKDKIDSAKTSATDLTMKVTGTAKIG